jgi:hypothetical protein
MSNPEIIKIGESQAAIVYRDEVKIVTVPAGAISVTAITDEEIRAIRRLVHTVDKVLQFETSSNRPLTKTMTAMARAVEKARLEV